MEDLHNYQLHMVDRGSTPTSLNAAITGLKCFNIRSGQLGTLLARCWVSAARRYRAA